MKSIEISQLKKRSLTQLLAIAGNLDVYTPETCTIAMELAAARQAKNQIQPAVELPMAELPTIEVSLTEAENTVLSALISDLYAEPCFSDVDCEQIAKKTGKKVASVKGIIGSLVKKGLVSTETMESSGQDHDLIYLNHNAYNLHPNQEWKDSATATTIITVIAKQAKSLTSKLVEEGAIVVEINGGNRTITSDQNMTMSDAYNISLKSTKKSSVKTKQVEMSVMELIVPPANHQATQPIARLGKGYANKGKQYTKSGERFTDFNVVNSETSKVKNFKSGDAITFILSRKGGLDTVQTGTFLHVNKCAACEEGYVVIKSNGKLFERRQSRIVC